MSPCNPYCYKNDGESDAEYAAARAPGRRDGGEKAFVLGEGKVAASFAETGELATLSKKIGDAAAAANLITFPSYFLAIQKLGTNTACNSCWTRSERDLDKPGSCTTGNGKASVYALVSMIAVLHLQKRRDRCEMRQARRRSE